jgi:hypothetical protein
MAGYMGKTTMGDNKTPLPMTPSGQLDINALVGQLVYQQKTYAWDTLKLPPGTTVRQTGYNIFATPIGQNDPYNGNTPKTQLETSMTDVGKFVAPTDFILNNLGVYFLPGCNLFDIQQIINHAYFEFKVLNKVLWSGHMQRHPSGMGLSGLSNFSGDHLILNGVAEPQKIWHFGDWKIYIPPQVQFTWKVTFPQTYDLFYNITTGQGAAATNMPADIQAKLITPGVCTAAALPTLQTQAQGGNGVQMLFILNGISNGPVQ